MAKTKKTNIVLEFNSPSKVFNKHIYDVLFDYSKTTEIHYGGASSGKSHGVVQKVVIKACQKWKHPRKILFLRKVGATIKDSIFEDVKSCLSDLGLLERCKVNMTDYRITLPNGAVFLFKGMDDPEKIKSIKGLSDILMEEATEFTLEDYTQLTIRLREKKHKNRQIFLMFNPVSKTNWVFKHFFAEGVKVNPKRVIIYHTSYKNNKFLDDEVKQTIEELAERNPAYYRIYALGEFATLDKLVFPKYEKRLLSKEELKHLPSFFGLDFGYINDPSAFVHVKINQDTKTIYIMEEYVKKHMLNNEIAEMIKSLGYAKEEIYADSAEKKSIDEIRLKGISKIKPVKKGAGSVLQGIQFIQQYKIIIDERCFKTIEEFDNYTWKKDKKTNEYINEPVDTYNHTIDAVRYALSNAIFTLKKPSIASKVNKIKGFF
ncbi:PBSX family phage terminase large subunit [Vagococcus lutrae]|uniref:PBSX family phage terminase large subunit n=1 Tax=Vagococcus lutrae TaxID=81947 RepID=UPI00288DB2A0|nr:PBSX family phage terminase large subunit [Vagococcus lutrae]MDT2805252.1 PBSX family phage terminase large subunit [Vagococcus lutrae]